MYSACFSRSVASFSCFLSVSYFLIDYFGFRFDRWPFAKRVCTFLGAVWVCK